MNSTAVITLERVWGTETSPYNTASIRPFIDGIKAFSDSFDFYYSHFYGRESLREALNEFLNPCYRRIILQIAGHGSGNRVGVRWVSANTLSHHRPYRSGRPSHLGFTAVSQRSNLYSTLAMTNLFVWGSLWSEWSQECDCWIFANNPFGYSPSNKLWQDPPLVL